MTRDESHATPEARAAADAGEVPPVPLSWGALYALVIVALAASIAALAWLTRVYQ